MNVSSYRPLNLSTKIIQTFWDLNLLLCTREAKYGIWYEHNKVLFLARVKRSAPLSTIGLKCYSWYEGGNPFDFLRV